MPTTFVKGDLFEDAKATRLYGLAVTADCGGAMDTGVTVAFKKRWPALAEAYRAHAETSRMQLGDVFVWREHSADDASEEPGAVIFVLGMQHGEKKAKVSMLVRVLDTMIARATADGVTRIGIPRIGANNGMDPLRVKRVLTEAGEKTPIDLVVYEQFVRAKPSTDATE